MTRRLRRDPEAMRAWYSALEQEFIIECTSETHAISTKAWLNHARIAEENLEGPNFDYRLRGLKAVHRKLDSIWCVTIGSTLMGLKFRDSSGNTINLVPSKPPTVIENLASYNQVRMADARIERIDRRAVIKAAPATTPPPVPKMVADEKLRIPWHDIFSHSEFLQWFSALLMPAHPDNSSIPARTVEAALRAAAQKISAKIKEGGIQPEELPTALPSHIADRVQVYKDKYGNAEPLQDSSQGP